MDESTLINQYIKPIISSNKEALSLLDDVAFIENIPNKTSWVITTDCMVEGVHFFKNEDPKSIAYRLIISNLSDIATKGAIPKYFTLTFCPNNIKELNPSWVKVFFETINSLQTKYNIKLIGGNIANTNSVSMYSLTVIGELNIPKKNIPFRFNSKSNDLIYMSGYTGDAYLGYCIIATKKGLIKEPFWLKKLNILEKNYLIDSYYYPKISISLSKKLLNIANSCTDASDGILFSVKSICDSFNEKKYVGKNSFNKFSLNAQINLSCKMFSDTTQKILSISPSEEKLELLTNLLTWGGDYNLVFSVPKNKSIFADDIIQEYLNKKINIVYIGKFVSDTVKKDISILDFNNKKINISSINNYRHT